MLINLQWDLNELKEMKKNAKEILETDEYFKDDAYFKSIVECSDKVEDNIISINNIDEYKDCPNGFYEGRSFNKFDSAITYNEGIKIEEFDSFKQSKNGAYSNYRQNYGCCDDYEDVLRLYPELVDNDREFFVVMDFIFKDEQPEMNGFRVSRNGGYVGTKVEDMEYLYDEPLLDFIFVFHIYELVKEYNEK